MVKKSETALQGMQAICDYYGRSAATILKLQREYGFPIRKDTGSWFGDRSLIDDWQKDYVAGRTERWLARP
jgi:hypothetical protein